MSIDGEKKFVMKHTFMDVKNMRNNSAHNGMKETHFNIPWSIYFYPYDSSAKAILRLECNKPCEERKWSVNVTVDAKVLTAAGGVYNMAKNHNIYPETRGMTGQLFNSDLILANYLVDGNMTVECHALFLGNFDESKQSEVELKDIDPWDFQKFLECLYGDPDITENTVRGILKLADMYDAKMVVRHCEKFFVTDSKLDLKEKYLMAIQYKLENLKKKCMLEFKNVEDIDSIIPEDSDQFDSKTWKELLKLCVSISKNR